METAWMTAPLDTHRTHPAARVGCMITTLAWNIYSKVRLRLLDTLPGLAECICLKIILFMLFILQKPGKRRYLSMLTRFPH